MAKWPTIEVRCPEEAFKKMLEYWDDVLKPCKGRYEHPDDKKRKAELRAAIKLLLEFCR